MPRGHYKRTRYMQLGLRQKQVIMQMPAPAAQRGFLRRVFGWLKVGA